MNFIIRASLATLFVLVPTFSYAQVAKKAPEFDHSHKQWTAILSKNVVSLRGGKATALRYKAVDKTQLKNYVDGSLKVTKKQLSSWTKNQKLAFYFNLYNALTVQLILKNYPLKSIQDIGAWYRPTWKKKFFTIFGKEANLDQIEHTWVREDSQFKEARVHFAFNCASIGCPALLPTAFVAKDLDKQLEAAMLNFLSDSTRNSYDAKTNTLKVSQIFEWYGKDFAKGWNGYKSLKGFFAKYASKLATDPKHIDAIRNQKVKIDFNKYNWDLNEAK